MSILDDLIGCNRHPLADLSAHNSPYSNLRMCKQYNEQSRLALGQARLAQAEHLRPKKYGDTVLNPDRPLTGVPADYVNTGDEPRYECHTDLGLTVYHYKFRNTGVDIEQFRKDCEEIDRERD